MVGMFVDMSRVSDTSIYVGNCDKTVAGASAWVVHKLELTD